MAGLKDKKVITSIALVKAAYATPFRLAMQRNGLSPEYYFRKNNLPLHGLDDPDSLVPEKPFWRLINQVAISEGIPDFGMQVAQAQPWFEIETLRRELIKAQTLGSLLETFCAIASSESSMVTFALSRESETCSFEFRARPLIPNDIQMELYRVTSMIGLVRGFLGLDWQPPQIGLMMGKSSVAEANRILSDSEILFNHPTTTISFPRNLLDTKCEQNRYPAPSTANTSALAKDLADKTEIITALKEILDNYVGERELRIELIADIVGLSTRNLQRLIKSQGSTYRDLCEAARLRYALRKLDSTTASIADIATKLGYSDAGHFTRAFRRWTGITPSTHRARPK